MATSPEGVCTCDEDGAPCEYCQAMALWAHEELYGAEDPGIYQTPREAKDDWDWDDAQIVWPAPEVTRKPATRGRTTTRPEFCVEEDDGDSLR